MVAIIGYYYSLCPFIWIRQIFFVFIPSLVLCSRRNIYMIDQPPCSEDREINKLINRRWVCHPLQGSGTIVESRRGWKNVRGRVRSMSWVAVSLVKQLPSWGVHLCTSLQKIIEAACVASVYTHIKRWNKAEDPHLSIHLIPQHVAWERVEYIYSYREDLMDVG